MVLGEKSYSGAQSARGIHCDGRGAKGYDHQVSSSGNFELMVEERGVESLTNCGEGWGSEQTYGI